MRVCAFDLEIADPLPDGFAWEHPLAVSCAATALQGEEFGRVWADDIDVLPGFAFAPKMSPVAIGRLVDYLWDLQAMNGIPIVTWNGLSFDFRALALQAGGDRALEQKIAMLAMNHIDLMFQIRVEKGFPISLQAAADGLGVEGKTEGMSGSLAPDMWRFSAEDQRKVLDYVRQDAECTLRVYQALKAQGQLTWITKSGTLSRRPWFPSWIVDDQIVPPGYGDDPGPEWHKAHADAGRHFPTVRECIDKVPRADTSWMSFDPPPLETYYGWTAGMISAALRPVLKHEDDQKATAELEADEPPAWDQAEWNW